MRRVIEPGGALAACCGVRVACAAPAQLASLRAIMSNAASRGRAVQFLFNQGPELGSKNQVNFLPIGMWHQAIQQQWLPRSIPR
eukprot:6068274-Pyramimonas_sp.AAC.1